jgi:hypothetical protein
MILNSLYHWAMASLFCKLEDSQIPKDKKKGKSNVMAEATDWGS